MTWVKAVIAVAILAVAYFAYDAIGQTAVKTQQLADLTDEIEQIKASRAETERLLKEAQNRERQEKARAATYRQRLASASDECLRSVASDDVQRLLAEITTPNGIGGLSARTGRIIEDATHSTMEAGRDVLRRGGLGD